MILAFSGVEKIPLGYIRKDGWPAFQDSMESRGLPRPPDVEPGYCYVMKRRGKNIPVIVIHEDFKTDVATLVRESEYACNLTLFFNKNIVISETADRTVRKYLRARFPKAGPQTIRTKREIFVRLFGNLRSRRTLLLLKEQGLPINRFYFKNNIIAKPVEKTYDLRQSLTYMFRNDWRDVVYYGTTLIGLPESPPWLSVGGATANTTKRWIEASVDQRELRTLVNSVIDQELNNSVSAYLRPTNPRYYSHMGGYRTARR